MTTERRIQSLDILRVIAVSAVLLNHGIFSSRLYQLANRYDIAELAVEVFFVLSGYLITNLLITSKERHTPTWHFYLRRCFRLMPSYFVMLLICSFVIPLINTFLTPDLAKLNVKFTMWQMTAPWQIWCYCLTTSTIYLWGQHVLLYGPTWSLAVEEQFYLVWPLIILLVPLRHLKKAILLVCAIALIATCRFDDAKIYIDPIANFLPLGIGGLIAVLTRGVQTTSRRRALTVTASCAVICIAAYSMAHPPPGEEFYQHVRVAIVGTHLTRITMAAAIFLLTLFGFQPIVDRIRLLQTNAITVAGKMTYGIYLWHMPVNYVLGEFIPAGIRLTLANIVGILLMSGLSFVFLEQPMVRLGRQLTSRNSATDVAGRKAESAQIVAA